MRSCVYIYTRPNQNVSLIILGYLIKLLIKLLKYLTLLYFLFHNITHFISSKTEIGRHFPLGKQEFKNMQDFCPCIVNNLPKKEALIILSNFVATLSSM